MAAPRPEQAQLPVSHYRPERSATPLARQHDLRLRRAKPSIPWQRFDRDRHPPRALTLAAAHYLTLASGEYDAVEGFSRLTSALARHGAPFDLIAATAEVPADEIRHADYAARMASLCSGRPVEELELDVRARMTNPGRQQGMSVTQLDVVMASSVAIGETIAATFITECAAGAQDPVVEAFLAHVLSDEIRHARLGWYYLAWRAPRWTRAEQQRVADAVGAEIVDLEVRYGGRAEPPRGTKKAAAALGVTGGRKLRRAFCQIAEEQIVPGLDALGLGASHAWAARKRFES